MGALFAITDTHIKEHLFEQIRSPFHLFPSGIPLPLDSFASISDFKTIWKSIADKLIKNMYKYSGSRIAFERNE